MEKIREGLGDHLLNLRNLRISDSEVIGQIMHELYDEMSEAWTYEQIKTLVDIFPEGQLCIEDKGRVVAFALSIIIDKDLVDEEHTYHDITGNETFSTHNPEGDILYGIEVAISKSHQGMRLGRRLYDARKELCEQLNLRSIVGGGRMPNYAKYRNELSPKEYIEKVKQTEIYDPVLTFQLNNDFHVKKILPEYLPEDKDSRAYATLIEWNNIYYRRKSKKRQRTRNTVRIGLVQWQMRRVNSMDSLMENVEFFVDSVSNYQADFLLFPELFNAPILAQYNELDTIDAISELAKDTEEIRDRCLKLAVDYNINIIAGSLPQVIDGKMYNVSYLCRRDGTYEGQRKIHITWSEKTDWGIVGGEAVRVFNTDVAKIGILICYDVEFPELPRIMAEKGLQILFVPFATDMQTGYQRVRICSQARAIENECYVAIAGSVGNLPKVSNMDLQYAQSAIFSPSDFAFPQNAVIAEGTLNNEMTIIADVDLNSLKDLRVYGSVNNMNDRRKDLYEINWKKEL
ncbi:MAG: bifunctional GNAT family N-acetyltransferase/carbon-nitrogen hydrolase family protein [Bacteroidales bacterium]|nr:bifunctional GNAT family N-acetyltransferase/carbon-nitrogen hydrolase family protein [Bacteroidales bacterium]MCF8351465.1 bifunctional GNAT family N-acetyltransferase/carbon-nitrogen hydrolase family protein [Bacteroidales bacterium]MCF8375071.1 bifunctional GNAT family N-acetyltransferase/carbon-nitrogen hydrolase family protein [Bacteroidales bacterium]MCF8399977.1 bifunctional GNAT family N-acetyltransferase/carbon-nitrogen hydrolase family protein [Bacteroidales bacterium]